MSEEPCTKLGAELSGYHDGMLDEATRLKVEAHLQSCAVCRARLADYARVDRAVQTLGAPLFEDRLREDLVAYARATIAERGRQSRRQRQLARFRSRRTLIPLAAAAGVAVLVLKLTDGGFRPSPPQRQQPAAVESYFESQAKLRAEADSQPSATGSTNQPALGAPDPLAGIRTAEPPSAPEEDRVPARDAKPEQSPAGEQYFEQSNRGAQAQEQLPSPIEKEDHAKAVAEAPPAMESAPVAEPSPPPPAAPPPPLASESAHAESRSSELMRAKDQSAQSAGNLAADRSQATAKAAPPPASGRGHLDPEAALSIASLALQVGDLTGARLALQGLPTLPPDSLTARAAVLALTLAERSRELTDCKAARERADALVEAAPSSALADTLRVRRAGLPCPH